MEFKKCSSLTVYSVDSSELEMEFEADGGKLEYSYSDNGQFLIVRSKDVDNQEEEATFPANKVCIIVIK